MKFNTKVSYMNLLKSLLLFSPFLFALVIFGFVIDIYLKVKLNCQHTVSSQQSLTNAKNIQAVKPILNHNRIVRNGSHNPLDECYHVYLDVGTNVGIQIRKLFEPSKYPGASVHSIFDLSFGTFENRQREGNKHKVCAIGFEPNFQHTADLKKLEKTYNDCGWKVKIFTETAVSDHNGGATFYFSRIMERLIGGGIVPPNQHDYYSHSVKVKNETLTSSNVTLLRLSDFLIDIVGNRKIPMEYYDPKFPPRVVMKMDIEGSEIDVLPDLLFTGSLQYLNTLMIEWHPYREMLDNRKNTQNVLENTLRLYSSNSKDYGGSYDFTMLNLDDETYYMSSFDLPKC